jgi:NAD kinase
VVISADKVIEIETDPKMPEHIFACDGFSEQVLTPGAKIRVQKSSRVVKLVNMKGKYFYKILREKLKWGT